MLCACPSPHPDGYWVADSVDLQIVWERTETINAVTYAEIPKARIRTKKPEFQSYFGALIGTVDPNAAFTVELWDGSQLLNTRVSRELDFLDGISGEPQHGPAAVVRYRRLYKEGDCRWNELCVRDLQLVISGTSEADASVSIVSQIFEGPGFGRLPDDMLNMEVEVE